jgi:hypothetical protein
MVALHKYMNPLLLRTLDIQGVPKVPEAFVFEISSTSLGAHKKRY